jgi:protein-disulfide isomerase
MTAIPCAFLLTVFTASLIAHEPPRSRDEIEAVVRDYILQHPEVLLESVRSYQERQRAGLQQEARKAVAAHQDELLRDPASPTSGEVAGKVPVVVFLDYRCGYCKRVDPDLLQLADSKNAYLVFKDLPILGPESVVAASAALAAHRQGRYFDMHRALMQTSEPVTEGLIDRLADDLKLDKERLHSDMRSREVSDALSRNHKLASALGVRATPTYVIGSEFVSGALDAAALEKHIANARTAHKVAN